MHEADAVFYSRLNSLLAGYDLVLFEALMSQVAIDEELFRSPDSGASGELMSPEFGEFLGLVSQFPRLQLHSARFTHADLSLETYTEILESQGGEQLELLGTSRFHGPDLPQAVISRLQQCWPRFENLLSAIGAGQVFHESRRVFCEWFHNLSKSIAIDSTSVIFEPREQRCMDILEQRLKEIPNDSSLRIAILYGAAHGQTFTRHLHRRLGFIEHGEPQWIDAVSVDPKRTPKEGHYARARELFQD